MVLKQCRVPRTLTLSSDRKTARTSSIEEASRRRSVLYEKLPAQFVSFAFSAQPESVATTGLARVAESRLKKVRLSTTAHESYQSWGEIDPGAIGIASPASGRGEVRSVGVRIPWSN